MRGYVEVTPKEIEGFASNGIFKFPSAFVLTSHFQRANVDEDHEELEFQLSFLAALKSRQRLQSGYGYVVAIDLEEVQLGSEGEETIELVSELRWDQVDSILVAESEEEELAWFARQEVDVQLPIWLEAESRDGST